MALMLSGPNNQVLAVRIWQEWEQGNLNEASALGVLMVLVMGVVVFVAQRVAGSRFGATTIRSHAA